MSLFVVMSNTSVIIRAVCLGFLMIACFATLKSVYIVTSDTINARYTQQLIYHNTVCSDNKTVVEITKYKEKPRLINYATEESKPLGPSLPFNQSYSNAKFHIYSGANAIAATNVCFKFDGVWKIQFFHPPGSSILNETVYNYSRVVRSDFTFQYGFKFKWDLANVEGPIPSDYFMIPGITNVVQPGWVGHLGHWDEAVLGLFHFLLYPHMFPWIAHMNRLLILNSPEDDIKYNKEILNIILSIMPEEDRKRLTIEYGSRKQDLKFCLEKAVLVGWSIHERWGSFFADVEEAQIFREAAWKYFNITPRAVPHRMDNVTAFFINRGQTRNPGRHLTNRNEVIEYIHREHPWITLHPNSGPMHVGTVREQIQWMMESDILIGEHGSSLFNSMFMQSHSVVIDMTPGTIMELCFHDCAVSSGHVYFFDIPPDNSKMRGWTENSWPKKCYDNEFYNNWLDESCQVAWNYDFEANTKRLGALLLQAKMYINYVKRMQPRILY